MEAMPPPVCSVQLQCLRIERITVTGLTKDQIKEEALLPSKEATKSMQSMRIQA
jgi:hypothetical protein